MLNAIQKKFDEQRERRKLIESLTKEDAEQLQKLIKEEEEFNREVLIVALAGTTAAIHISLATPLFVLNGVGFLASLAAHRLVPQRESYQKYTRDALLGYTGFTAGGYFAVKGFLGFLDPLGVATKLVELGLLRVLWEEREAAKGKLVVVVESKQGVEMTDVSLETMSGKVAIA